jgi:hypothetical protein
MKCLAITCKDVQEEDAEETCRTLNLGMQTMWEVEPGVEGSYFEDDCLKVLRAITWCAIGSVVTWLKCCKFVMRGPMKGL